MRLKIKSLGTDCEGIELKGNPKSPEPDHVRISFPGGDVEVVRCSDASLGYWVHVRVDHEESLQFGPDSIPSRILDARLDQTDKHASQADVGDFGRDQLYHLAVRVARKPSTPSNNG